MCLLQILGVLLSLFLIYHVCPWYLGLLNNCYGSQHSLRNYTCELRQQRCGDSGLNLSYPFRFHDDPSPCGEFNLSCQHNRTVFYPYGPDLIPGEHYYVQRIDYENQTIRLIDPGMQKDNCSTLPLFSLHDLWYRPSEPLVEIFRSNYDTQPLVFVSCKGLVRSESKLKFHHLVDSATCNFSAAQQSSSYNYVLYGGDLLVSDIEESCTINRVLHAQIDDASLFNQTGHDVSFLDIHNLLVRGFQLHFPFNSEVVYLSFWCEIVLLLAAGLRKTSFIIRGYLPAGPGYGAFMLIARTAFGILLLVAFLIYKWRRRHLSMYDSIEEFLQANNGLMPIRYSYREIKSMTNNFREKLGEGGYGLVYKGKLRSGSLVAVKMLNKSKANGQEFINEVATIGRIHHVNVVRLVGFCLTSSTCALVYDYMSNGSLDKFIFSANPNESSLCWKKAYEIAMGVARGIAYLHQGCNMQILHFDIKPHNILLDDNFVPKVSDFGLAKLYPVQDGYVATLTAIRGTLGYMAPELFYKKIGRVSNKTDVYSFGMLLMDIAGRWRNAKEREEHSSQVYFTSWIYDKFEQGMDIEIGDRVTDEDKEIAKKLILIGLWCIQMTPTNRPTMREAIEMLEGDLQGLQLPPKPLFHPADSPMQIQSHCSSSSQEFTEPLSVTLEIEQIDI